MQFLNFTRALQLPCKLVNNSVNINYMQNLQFSARIALAVALSPHPKQIRKLCDVLNTTKL